MTTQAPQAAVSARILSATLTLDLLRIGTILTGRVAAVAPDGKIRLETPGGSLQLQSNAALGKGDVVRLEVGRDNGQTTLRIADHRPANPQAPQSARPGPTPAQLPQVGQPPIPAQTAGSALPAAQTAQGQPVQAQILHSQQPLAHTSGTHNQAVTRQAGTGQAAIPSSTAAPAAATPSTPAGAGQTANLQAAVAAATRDAVARQGSLAPLFATLASVPASAAAPALPAAAQAIFERLLGMRLSLDTAPTADDIETALQRSGVFHEAGQARGAPQQGQGADLKSLLALMRRAMPPTKDGSLAPPPGEPRPALPDARGRPEPQRPMTPLDGDLPADELMAQLARQGDAALSRVKLLQMASLPERSDRGAEAATRDVVIDVPIVRDGQTGVMQFRVTRDADQAGQAEAKGPIWRVRFAVDIEATGAVDALITLQQGRIGVAIWADRKTTADALNAQLTDLDQAIRAADLDIDTLNVRQGRAPMAEPRPAEPVFVDIAS